MMRIISTVPSQTELLHYLGLDAEVVGITKFCIHPKEWFETKCRIGGTKQLNIEKIRALQPDWILANKEENVKEQIEYCATFCNSYVSEVSNLNTALEMIESIGSITNTITKSTSLSQHILARFETLPNHKARVAYLIWYNPIMTVGSDTFIHDMLSKIGWENAFDNATRYPTVTEQALKEAQLDILLLSSEPFPFNDSHVAYFRSLLPNTTIILVDGTYFSWYGSRLLQAPDYFETLISTI